MDAMSIVRAELSAPTDDVVRKTRELLASREPITESAKLLWIHAYVVASRDARIRIRKPETMTNRDMLDIACYSDMLQDAMTGSNVALVTAIDPATIQDDDERRSISNYMYMHFCNTQVDVADKNDFAFWKRVHYGNAVAFMYKIATEAAQRNDADAVAAIQDFVDEGVSPDWGTRFSLNAWRALQKKATRDAARGTMDEIERLCSYKRRKTSE